MKIFSREEFIKKYPRLEDVNWPANFDLWSSDLQESYIKDMLSQPIKVTNLASLWGLNESK